MLLRPRAAAPNPRHVIMAAFGRPVDPDVKTTSPMSSIRLLRQAFSQQLRLLLLQPLAQLDHLLEGKEARAIVVTQSARIDDDDIPQFRQALADAQNLVELLLVLADDERRIRQRQQIFDLRRRRCRIDAGRNAAKERSAELGENPFLSVLAQNRDLVAGLEAEADEPVAEASGRRSVLRPGDRLPDAKILLAQRHHIGTMLRPVEKLARQRQLAERLVRGLRCALLDHDSHRLRRL